MLMARLIRNLIRMDDYDVGAVYVESDVDMSRIYSKDGFNDNRF